MTKTTNSPDLINEEIKKLGEVFPEFVSEGEVDIDGLQRYLQNEKVDGEWYTMNRHGKSQAKLIAREPSTATLRPDHTQSKDWEITKNILIEGDNLEVLKLLQNKYYEQVKCIYIDPPYNKDKDFVYRDTWKDPVGNYMRITGQIDDEGEISTDIETTGRKHSNWLSMMYPRLYLARKLLKDDGVIFVSIDDDEVHNLRKLMDEIFGEDNFIGEFIRQSKVGGGSDSKHLVKEHEYCVGYTKSIEMFPELFTEHNEEYLKRYKDEDELGKYFWDTFARPGLKNPINYDIVAPDSSIINGDWIRSKATFQKNLENGEIRFISKEDGKRSVQFKQYLNEDGKKARSLTSDLGSTIDGKNDIRSCFGNDKIFSYPKPVKLIKFLLKLVTTTNDIILDFFAGSGTTGHAVMDLNAEDGNNRQYILIQLPELIDPKEIAYKAGYRKISEITRDRLIKAGEKINKGDIGFRFLSLATSNFQELDAISIKEGETTEDQLFDRIALEYDAFGIKQDRSDDDIIYELLLRYGYSLHSYVGHDNTFKKRYKIIDDTTQDKEFFLSLESKVSDEVIAEFIKLYHNQSNIVFVCKDDSVSPSSRLTLANYFPGFTTL